MSERLDVAYYYPAPYWGWEEVGWVKSLLLFFDKISILLPRYMYGRHHDATPALAEPLEDLGLLEVLEPGYWIDEEMTQGLTEAVIGLLANGVFDDLPTDLMFHELSQSRIGYRADIKLAEWVVSELQQKGLAKPSKDGVSIPLHPVVRTTILVLLAQLSRSAGKKHDVNVHPATHDRSAVRDLVETLSREQMPSHNSVIAFDLEPVSFNLKSVPIDELLDFRNEHKAAHRTYMRDLRGFMAELADIDAQEERAAKFLQRRQEISYMAHELQRSARSALGKNLPSWSFGLAGSAWSVIAGDPIGTVLSTLGLASSLLGLKSSEPAKVTAYSYLFQVERSFSG